jgi:Rrf2 family cysteine metabolism transcriptional repressor
MTFTAKEDYGLRASLVLAAAWDATGAGAVRHTLQARDIASHQQIPEPFLEQVLATLRRAGLVNAIRGSTGGYELARAPETISAADILRALSGPLVPSKLLERQTGGSTPEGAVIRYSVWNAVEHTLTETLEGLTLKHLLEESQASLARDAYGMYI